MRPVEITLVLSLGIAYVIWLVDTFEGRERRLRVGTLHRVIHLATLYTIFFAFTAYGLARRDMSTQSKTEFYYIATLLSSLFIVADTLTLFYLHYRDKKMRRGPYNPFSCFISLSLPIIVIIATHHVIG
jgi:hypothetical protein